MNANVRRALVLTLITSLIVACSGSQTPTVDQTALSSPTLQSTAPAPATDPTATMTPMPATATTIPSPTATSTPMCTPSPTVPATPTPTPEPPPTVLPLPESQTVDLPDIDAHYRLHVNELRVSDGFVSASEVITIREFHAGIPDELFLQVVPAAYGFFTLHDVSLDGAAIEPETLSEGFTLVIDLPPGSVAPLEIALEFTLTVGVDPAGWAGTMLDGKILRLGNWFPMISNLHGFSEIFDPSYTATAEFDVSLTIDPAFSFAHTGEIVAERDVGDGRVAYDLHAANVRDFALAISSVFTVDQTVTSTGVHIELYTSPAGSETRQNILRWAASAIEQMTDLIGPYPYASFRIVDAGPSMPGGLEFPGLIYINPAYPDLERLIYHEVAHQWLYGIIGTRTLEDGWIDEGGAEFFERGLPTGFSEVPAIPAGGYVYPLDSTYRELSGAAWIDAYYAIYEQGARFYHSVLAALGWDRFWASMRALYASHAFGIVTGWDVLSNWQRHSPVDLRPLYHDYFRYEWIDQLPEPGA